MKINIDKVSNNYEDGRWSPEMLSSFLGLLDEHQLISKEDYESKINKINDKTTAIERLARIMSANRYPENAPKPQVK